jgi:hypothetical protein
MDITLLKEAASGGKIQTCFRGAICQRERLSNRRKMTKYANILTYNAEYQALFDLMVE